MLWNTCAKRGSFYPRQEGNFGRRNSKVYLTRVLNDAAKWRWWWWWWTNTIATFVCDCFDALCFFFGGQGGFVFCCFCYFLFSLYNSLEDRPKCRTAPMIMSTEFYLFLVLFFCVAQKTTIQTLVVGVNVKEKLCSARVGTSNRKGLLWERVKEERERERERERVESWKEDRAYHSHAVGQSRRKSL